MQSLFKTPFKLTRQELLCAAAASIVLQKLTKIANHKNIASLCEKPQYGYTEKASSVAIGPRFVRITDIKNGFINWGAVPYCSCEKKENYSLRSGDILIGRTGSVGKSFIVDEVPESAVYASYLIRLRPFDGINSRYLYWCLQSNSFWDQILTMTRGSAIKNINGKMLASLVFPVPNRSLQDEVVHFLDGISNYLSGQLNRIPNVSKTISDKRRIVISIEQLASKLDYVVSLRNHIANYSEALLHSSFNQIIRSAPYKRMAEVAPIIRRPVRINTDEEYLELGIRSFGRGTFHKPPLDAISVGSKKLYWIEQGDLIFSNVFAWEGAIAVAKPEDNHRVGSHRFIACAPKGELALSDFLCFYFLTPEGLEKISVASPGGAGRNRTLGLKKLEQIEVPVPPFEKQVEFKRLQGQVGSIYKTHEENKRKLDALFLSILDRAFKGEL